MTTIAFFNNKGGVGKTSLVYHLAWMYADLGRKVIAADFDPQANLSSMFLDEDRLEELWPDHSHPDTVMGAIPPIVDGIGDVRAPHVEEVTTNLGLIVGDLSLSVFEDELSQQWPQALGGNPRSFRVESALHRLLILAGKERAADIGLIDVGPNLGAINRAALIAADFVVVPLAPDLFSLQGLRNLGPSLRSWRADWIEILSKNMDRSRALTDAITHPLGYVILQRAARADRPVKAYDRWMNRIPEEYRAAMLDSQQARFRNGDARLDPNCLAVLKDYRSLTPMAIDARKPMFNLRVADGAIGAHASAVRDCYAYYQKLALQIEQAAMQMTT